MSAKSCGGCTMCCKLMGISDLDPPKPVNQWCRHCKPGQGCTIYESRPTTCREFECLWLLSQEPGRPQMDLAMRPDKSKVVIAPTTNPNVMAAFVDPAFPRAWDEGDMRKVLRRLALQDVRIVISHGISREKIVLERQGHQLRTRKITMSEPDETGMQWYEPEE